MIIDPGERIAPVQKSGGRLAVSLALSLAGAAAFGLVAFPELRSGAMRAAYDAGSQLGLEPSQDGYVDLYKRLGVGPLPAHVFASQKIAANLDRLLHESCDRAAIFALSQALVAEHETRAAAMATFGFASTCPNSENEEMRAAQLLFQLGDLEKTIAMTDDLVARNPSVPYYRYLRAKALAGAGRYEAAVADYQATIQLTKDPKNVGEHVYFDLAGAYAALGRNCEAAASIAAWVALDPAKRNTMRAIKLEQEYIGRGCSLPGSAPPMRHL